MSADLVSRDAFEHFADLLVRNPQQCEASRLNDGYMPAAPHYNGDQIRQPPIRALACEIRSGAMKRIILAFSTMSRD